jgi:hypothetical protein
MTADRVNVFPAAEYRPTSGPLESMAEEQLVCIQKTQAAAKKRIRDMVITVCSNGLKQGGAWETEGLLGVAIRALFAFGFV